jgi:NAD(P)-dependent dehydrogenase (short-subunit alcohol dehydrogenase family)
MAPMKNLQGKVVVVTGAASGIGRELALACAAEGARLAIADVDEKGLAETARLLPAGCESLQARCDVSKAADLESLAQRTYERFGAANVVFNNAGVAVAGPVWSAPLDEWKWVLDVNLMGVVHGIRAFVPRMLEAKTEGHVVNTASVAGLLSVPGSGVYCASKHAVVSLSECLHHDLRSAGSAIGVSVLCPAWVATGIADSERNRPAELAARNPLAAPYEENVRKAVASGKLTAAEVARITVDAVKANRFYVLPHQRIKASIESRMRDILDEREPVDVSRPR